MENRQFTDEAENYVILKLNLDDYKSAERSLPPEYTLAGSSIRSSVAGDEKRLLRRYFRNWKAPYQGRLKGWRKDSPIYVVHNSRLVGGVYLVHGNEFNDDESWGQLHYAFMDPSSKGKGIYSFIFSTAVDRARSWGLEGLYLNSDRHMLPDVYMRWGAVYWKTATKPTKLGPCRTLVVFLLRMINVKGD